MKIDMTEVQNQKTALSTSQTSLSNQIETAKSSFVNLVNSESLKGDVKSAINAKISNHQIPLLTNFSNAMSVLSAQYDKTIEQFQTTVSETAVDAIIDTDYLQGILDGFSSIETSISTVDKQTASIYNSISDIISLTNPDASAITTPLSEGKTILTDTKTNMESFNGWKRGDEYSTVIQVQTQTLESLSNLGNLSYTDGSAMAFYNGEDFLNAVKTVASKINNSTPVELLGLISNSINKNLGKIKDESILNALKFLKNSGTVISYASTFNVAGAEAIASFRKIKNGTWYGKPVASTKSGFKTWKQVNGDVNRFNIVKNAKKADEIINGTGKIAKNSGVKGFAKSVGVLGGGLAVLDGGITYLERREEYGETNAVIDGVAHTTSAIGSIYAGAAIGSAIPIPVVGTLAGAVGGYLINGTVNTLYDGFVRGKWDWSNFALW